jgi:hypothetical protein
MREVLERPYVNDKEIYLSQELRMIMRKEFYTPLAFLAPCNGICSVVLNGDYNHHDKRLESPVICGKSLSQGNSLSRLIKRVCSCSRSKRDAGLNRDRDKIISPVWKCTVHTPAIKREKAPKMKRFEFFHPFCWFLKKERCG